MSQNNKINKKPFIALFNRGGYVLDFNTANFDIFTMNSIGEAICTKYGLSKGKSLENYLAEATEENKIKLLKDLMEYYENEYRVFDSEMKEEEFSKQYKICKAILEENSLSNNPFTSSAETLKEKFSSEHISKEMDLMFKMQNENPTNAIGKAKELIESCCKTILDDREIKYESTWDITKLTNETFGVLKIMPDYISSDRDDERQIKAILGNLKSIAINIAYLRNMYGSGHGKNTRYKGLQPRHAKLAIGCSITLVNFLWDSHERMNEKDSK